ncbi:MAG: hypothetical protein LBV72_14325 [Tannerella sp.]|jgi:hypothetical protein|nr:hypothetical protein [Tannerella sp.]
MDNKINTRSKQNITPNSNSSEVEPIYIIDTGKPGIPLVDSGKPPIPLIDSGKPPIPLIDTGSPAIPIVFVDSEDVLPHKEHSEE